MQMNHMKNLDTLSNYSNQRFNSTITDLSYIDSVFGLLNYTFVF